MPDIVGEPLSLDHCQHVERFLARLNSPLSEYSFANLFLFRVVHQYRYVDKPVPCVLGVTYDGKRHALPLVPLDPSRVHALLGLAPYIYPLPEQLAGLASSAGLELHWNEADSDYVYAAPLLASLEGTRLRAKRAQVRTFEQIVRPAFEPLTLSNLSRARDVLELWASQVPRPRDGTDYGPCNEALDNFEALSLSGLLVSDASGSPCAFLLARRLGADSMAVHFAKGNRNHAGVYAYLFSRFAASVCVQWLNFEQDLGAPGLRQAKRALDPAHQLRKYRLSRAAA
jgi:hypothetical protein